MAGFLNAGNGLLVEEAEFLLELGYAATAVEQRLLAAGPGRMRLGIDIEGQRVARLAIGRAGDELGAVGHHHIDGVIIGMDALLHGEISRSGAKRHILG